MRKIANARVLQAELQRLLEYSRSKNPSRKVLAEELQNLADQTAAVETKADFTKLQHQLSADLDTFEMAWTRYSKDPVANKHKLDDALKYMKDIQFVAGVLVRNMEALKSG